MAADPRIPLAHWLPAAAAAPGVAVTAGASRADLLRKVDAWQAAFLAQPGEHHALHLDDGLEFAAALFGGWLAGKTLWLPGDTLAATLVQLDTCVQGRAGELPGAFAIPAAGADRAPSAWPVLDAGRCRLVLYTSGSTGEPGAISKSLRQLDNEISALDACFGGALGDAEVHGTVSHQHIYGLLFRLLWPLSAGRRFAPRRLEYNEQLTALGPNPVVLVASPAHLKRLPSNQPWSSLSEGLRAVFSSGGPLPADAALDVQRLWGQSPVEVFGSTETGGIAWRRSGVATPPWQALPGVEWRLRDGALEIRSPHLPDDAWYATQDRAAVAGDGGFELRGRADRIVKVEERRISLNAIERRLLASPLLAEARVMALPGHRILLAVAAVPTDAGREVLRGAGRAGLVEQLRSWLAGHADAIALPRRWRFLDALPADAQGKCSERRLAALFRPLRPEAVWQHRDAHAARCELEVRPELAAFEGHFPQAAVLPGVVLLDWAVQLGREAFGQQGGFERMEAVKFQHLVRPGTLLQLELEWRPGVLGFRFRSDKGSHASGRLLFAEQGA